MKNRPVGIDKKGQGGACVKHAPLFCFIIALTAAIAFLLAPTSCLTGESGGVLLFAFPIKPGESFEMGFIHSANLSPVADIIEWTGVEMMVRKTVFKAFGAGIPIPSDGIGRELVHTGEHYELLGIDKPMQSFGIMTQTVPDHHIVFRDRKVRLLELVGSGKLVNIRVEPVSMLERLLRGL